METPLNRTRKSQNTRQKPFCAAIWIGSSVFRILWRPFRCIPVRAWPIRASRLSESSPEKRKNLPRPKRRKGRSRGRESRERSTLTPAAIAPATALALSPVLRLAAAFSSGWKRQCSSEKIRILCGRTRRRSSGCSFEAADGDSGRGGGYLVLARSVATGAACAGETPFRMSRAAGGRGLSALANSRLTCHIWFSVKTPL